MFARMLQNRGSVPRDAVDIVKGFAGRATRSPRQRLLARSLAAVSFLGCVAASVTPASADFRICNDTKSLVGVALGYFEKGKWVTEGWWQVPGET